MDASHLKYQCTVEPNAYNIDKHYNLNIVGINNILDKCGLDHLNHIDFSIRKMSSKDKLGWALYQREVRIFEEISFEKKYTVKTYITGRHRIFTYRDYKILDADGKLCAESSSIWILFDLETRSFVKDYPQEYKDLIDPGNTLEPLERPRKVKFKIADGIKPDYEVQVRYSHCDFLGHLSNNHHIRMIYDALPVDIWDTHIISQFNTSFIKEAHNGDHLLLYAKVDNGQWFIDCRQGENSISKTIVSLKEINS